MTNRMFEALVLFAVSQVAFGQAVTQRNLDVCLAGRYPALCNHSLLTPEQLREAHAPERRENVKVCMTGKYTALCDHSKLSAEESEAVRNAERAENLSVCLTGKYPALCNHELLTTDELHGVRAAEKTENLRICTDGRYAALCDPQLLSPEQGESVAAAEARAAAARPPVPAAQSRASRGSDCKSGHWIDSIEGDGKVIRLADGSMWEVDDVDTVTTSIWLAVSGVIVCIGKIINVDDKESVDVTPIGASASRSRATSTSKRTYVVQASTNDETFVINDQIFKAKTYCFNFEKGDRVMFLSGSALAHARLPSCSIYELKKFAKSGASSSSRLTRRRSGRAALYFLYAGVMEPRRSRKPAATPHQL